MRHPINGLYEARYCRCRATDRPCVGEGGPAFRGEGPNCPAEKRIGRRKDFFSCYVKKNAYLCIG